MTTCPTRFGISLMPLGPVSALTENARRAEQIGFDVALLPDHLGFHAPVPTLVAIANAAPTLRVGHLVLNCGFYRPALLARDLASIDAATGGRLEIGLGTGHAEAEFIEAGLPFPSPRARIELLAEHITEIRARLANRDYMPTPVQSPPPIMVAGVGDRVLALAAQQADIVAIATMGQYGELADRVDYVKSQAAHRNEQPELAFSFFQLALDGPPDLPFLRRASPEGTDEELLQSTTLLSGSIAEAIDRIQAIRDDLGFSYFTLTLSPGTTWATLEKLIAALK